jgi:hypothetical protein
MKLCSQLIALCIISNNVLASGAFTLNAPKTPSSTVALRSSKANQDFEIFPTFDNMEYIEAGNTVRTYQMPLWATRVQMRFETNGRPLKGEANLWVGPIRKTHTLKFDTESGVEFPIEALLKFKVGPPVLKISTEENQNYPMSVGVFVPPPERAAELEANTDKVWNACKEEKQRIQGSNTDGRYGARVNWTVPHNVDSIQLLGWSKDVGKKSFKLDIELLQGPNNIKQKFFLQCGGGSQPYHAVLQTPGSGWTVRIRNKKYVEDGLVQVAVVPYKETKKVTGKQSMTWS